jgi:hypothetical protein
MRVRSAPLLVATMALLGFALAPAQLEAVETDIRYPAKVTTMQGEVYEFVDLRHDLARGSFVLYDGETEGRAPWRDIDKITFVGNIGHGPGALGPKKRGTRRVEVLYTDGHARFVNLVIGKIRGFDGKGERGIPPKSLSVIDFDEAEIAPVLYKACERGHVWEQEDFRFCPYDGLRLESYRVDGLGR